MTKGEVDPGKVFPELRKHALDLTTQLQLGQNRPAHTEPSAATGLLCPNAQALHEPRPRQEATRSVVYLGPSSSSHRQVNSPKLS